MRLPIVFALSVSQSQIRMQVLRQSRLIASLSSVLHFCLSSSRDRAKITFREIMTAYGKEIQGLAVDLAKKIKECIVGSSEATDFGGWRCNFKMNKYSFTPGTVGLSGVHEHTDLGFLTVVQDDDLNDVLEVLHLPTSYFVPIPHLPATLVANLGDVANVWSNGRFPNMPHRVQCKVGRTRISVVASLQAPRHRDVEITKEFVDVEHPLLFKPFNFERYIETRWSKDMRVGEALDFMRIH